MTREQKRAQSAFEKVSRHLGRDITWRDQYGGMAHKLPVLVRQAGLAQALAFVESRGKEAHKALLDDLAQTVGFPKADLLKRSREAQLSEYLLLTREVLAAAQWYKRFSQSVLDVEAGAGE
ncbi:type III-B CRISPR module-associated protein Cmr5 [Meiothermus granaticius]|uniref:CRISPR type III-B/RAMP module-associated protein Cmr5 n=1 Tax=Meiothermus granaticius NBRC 107808 TaxID=1227551 RepID=A0A399F748_9DEIN|nr:type III-B CRISPR module-associated protein Cmr5 [Meiothermus granaticius]RIH91466.1 CRISPR system Cmr subunit Cmr5 [Meiothermus granaticius NBRC 107808]GEM87849.1 CRISPR system Cmr subunit Cmr5 [Meiothermus granaticius NBRC 107808]